MILLMKFIMRVYVNRVVFMRLTEKGASLCVLEVTKSLY